MRSAFPRLWILQVLFLSGLGLLALLWPTRILEGYCGKDAPVELETPKGLARWVLDIERIPDPNETVRRFFGNHEKTRHREALALWASDDPDQSSAVWREVWAWVGRCEPPPAKADRPAIDAWLQVVDQAPRPDLGLQAWIATCRTDAPDGTVTLGKEGGEFRAWVLGAKQVQPQSWRIAADHVRGGAPYILAIAMFTLLGLLTPTIRRPLARSFLLIALFLTVAMLWGHMGRGNVAVLSGVLVGLSLVGSKVSSSPRAVFAWTTMSILVVWVGVLVWHLRTGDVPIEAEVYMVCAAGAMLLNAYYWLVGQREDRPQDDAGISQGRPPQLWTLWLIQFLVFLFLGFVALFFADDVMRVLMDSEHHHLANDMVGNQTRILGAWTLGIALLTFFALGASEDWVWRGAAWIFCGVFALFTLQGFLIVSAGEYNFWGYVVSIGLLLFLPFTYRLLKRDDPWFAENVEDDTKGWFLVDLKPAAYLFMAPLFRGVRRVFHKGVGARGWLTLDPDDIEGMPTHDLIISGKRRPATLRFSNRLFEDDASLDIRGCGLTLSHHPSQESPFDIMLSTGAFAPARDLGGFRATLADDAELKERMELDAVLREGMAAGQRRAPASYATMTYYQQTVMHWFTKEGDRFLVRFRLEPMGNPTDAERGVPDDDDIRAPWQRERRAGESCAIDYLRQELASRLERGPVTFLLQVQWHAPQPDDPVDWYDPSLEWEVANHPWATLGRIELTQALTEQECEDVSIDLGRHPSTLTVPRAPATGDPRALAATQLRVSRALGRLRRHRRRSSDVPPRAVPRPDAGAPGSQGGGA